MNAEGLRRPLCFVENKGQVTDQDNKQRRDVQYQLTTPGLNLYVGNGKLHYQFNKIEAGSSAVSSYGMDVVFAGANPHAKVIAAGEQAYYENYPCSGAAGHSLTAHSFNKIIYKDIYPGIDWQLYVKNGQVEYDFVVNPGGHASDIKLEYNGAVAMNRQQDGSIEAVTPMGTIREKAPRSYETGTGREVASGFALHNNVISFETGSYNGSLTIDPYLLFSTFLGGTGEDVVTSVKENGSGETYAAGFTASAGINTIGSAYGAATYEAFLAKYDATGARVYTTYLGPTGPGKTTKCYAMTLDNTGSNVFMSGIISSAGLPGAVVAYHAGNDGFVARIIGATGGLSWSTYFGGTSEDRINAITCDASNNIYITGFTASFSGISTGGAYQAGLAGIDDAFAAKLNGGTGAKLWGTYYGGSAEEEGFGVALDPSGNVLLTGQTNSIVAVATPGAHQVSLMGTNDAFIAELSSTGTSLLWGTYYGGSGEDQGNGIICDQVTGDIVLVGNTSSPDNVAGYKAFQSTYNGGPQDAFLAYFTGAGVMKWGTYFGGSQPDYGQGVCFDNFGNIVITGGTFSATNIAFPNAFQTSIAGDYDAYLAKFNTRGQELCSTYLGGVYHDYANAVACDNNNQLVIGGYTTSTGLYGVAGGLATAGAAQAVNGGGTYDGFISKFIIDTVLTIDQPYLDTLVCAGGTLKVNYTSNFAFQADNVLSVQLSDFTGSFAAPVVIGTLATTPLTTSGTITCVIPLGTIIHKGYRIRIVASDPGYTSPDNFYDIEVRATLTAPTVGGSSPVCITNTISLSVGAPYLLNSYSWSGPAGSGFGGTGFVSSLQNPSNNGFFGTGITKADSGIYYVTTSHNGCPDQTSSINIVVNNAPPPLPILTASVYGCLGGNISLSANPDTTAPGITYQWSGSEGFFSTLQNPVTPGLATSGSHLYTLTDDIGGCLSSSSILVTVYDTFHVAISIAATPGDTICKGTNVNFTSSTLNGGVSAHYQWMSGLGVPITGAMSDIFSTPSLSDNATIFCVVNSSLLCPSPISAMSNVITFNVISNPPVVKIFSGATRVKAGGSVTFSSLTYNSGTNPIYQWMVNGKDVAGANADTFVLNNVKNTDTVSLRLSTTMLCASPDYSISSPIVVQTTEGVNDVVAAFSNMELFPNPNNGNFVIKGDYNNGNGHTVTLEVLNPIGQVIYTDHAVVQNNSIEKAMNVSFPDGVYLLHISDAGQGKTLRFTVRN